MLPDVIPLRRPDPAPPLADPAPLLADARRLAPLLSIGIRTLRTWDARGLLPEPLRIGGKVLWNFSEIIEWRAAGVPPRDQWNAIRAARRK